jgi:ABC-type bacteriocin/lantibiotic exporter with double-glycine peptidase domain
VQLSVPHQQQTSSQLCWAACASMVCRFYGHVVTQTQFSTRFNANWGHGVNAMAAPGEAANLINALTAGAVTMDVIDRALTWQECRQHLTLRRLAIVIRQNHQFVISGFEDRDPRGNILWISDPGIHNAAKSLYATVAQDWVASLVKT